MVVIGAYGIVEQVLQLRLIAGYAGMRPVTAGSLMVAGAGLVALHLRSAHRWVAQALGLGVVSVEAVNLLFHLVGYDPGLTSFQGSVTLLLFGAALATFTASRRCADVLTFAGLVVAALSFVGYLFGVAPLYRVGGLTGMALQSTAGSALLGVGLLWVDAERGAARVLVSDSLGGRLARFLIPVSVFGSLGLGTLVLRLGVHRGWYDTYAGGSILVVVLTAGFVLVSWSAALAVDRSDAVRRETRGWLELVLRGIVDGFVVLDREFRIRYVGHVDAERLRAIGNDPEQVIGQVLWDVFPGLVGTESERVLKAAIRDRVPVTFETRFGERWYDVRAYPTADGGMSVLSPDITERRRAEEALRESEQQLSELVENLPELAWSARPDGYVDYYNSRWYEYTGTTPEQMVGSGWTMVHDPAVLPTVLEWWRGSLERAEPFEMEFRLRRADGGYGWFLTRVRPLRDSQGRIVRWFGTNTDITRLRDAEATARRSVERLETLARASEVLLQAEPDLQDLLGHLVKDLVAPSCCDRAMLALAGRDPRSDLEVVAWHHADPSAQAFLSGILAGKGVERARTISGRVLESGRAVLIASVSAGAPELAPSLRFVPYFDRYPVGSFVSVPLRTPRLTFGVLTAMRGPDMAPFTDDDRSLFEQIAARTALAVEAAQRYAEAQDAIQVRDDFLSVASHELKTPLTALQLQLQGMARQPAAGLEGRFGQKLGMATRQTLRLGKLVDDLLDVSRITGGRLRLRREEVDLIPVLREVVERHGDQAVAAGCTVTLGGSPSAVGSWDVWRVEQVFTNLITNALKYGAGGPIGITVARVDGVVCISVEDQGIGIRPEDRRRIFDRFERAVSSSHFGGLGLGLYLSEQIVVAHGGRIDVQSDPGRETRFTVVLPTGLNGASPP